MRNRTLLENINTCILVDELKCRDGVEIVTAEPYKIKELTVDGPAVVLIITD